MSAATPSHKQWAPLMWGASLSKDGWEKQSASFSLYLSKEGQWGGFVPKPHQLTFVQIKSMPGWRICSSATIISGGCESSPCWPFLQMQSNNEVLFVTCVALIDQLICTVIITSTLAAFDPLRHQTKWGWHPLRAWHQLQATAERYIVGVWVNVRAKPAATVLHTSHKGTCDVWSSFSLEGGRKISSYWCPVH